MWSSFAPQESRGAQGTTCAWKLSECVKPGHRPAHWVVRAFGRRAQGVGPEAPLSRRGRDEQACNSPSGSSGAGAPDKFEAGTPAIVNVIAFGQGTAADPAFRDDAFQGTTPKSGRPLKSCYHDALESYSGRGCWMSFRQTDRSRCRVPTAKAPDPSSTWTTPPALDIHLPIWDASARHGASPGKVGKTSFRRSSPSAPRVLCPLEAYDGILHL